MNQFNDFENKVESVGTRVWAFVKTNTLPLLVGLVIGYLFGLTF